MKKSIICMATVMFAITLHAQNNVGINTTSPQASLDVRGSQRVGGNSSYIKFDSATGRIEWVSAAIYAPVSQQIIRHSNSTEGLYAGGGRLEYRSTSGSVFFSDWTTGNGYFKTNLGIDNLTPQFPLSFKGSLGDKISLWGDGTPTHYGFGIQPSLFQMFSKTDLDDIAFGFGSSTSFVERMRVKGNGNVGIGITAPLAKLHIMNGSTGGSAPASNLLIESNGSNYMSMLAPDASASAIWFSKPSALLGGGIFYNDLNAPDGLLFRANNSPRMVIRNDGKVGIGINSAQSKLHVYGEESSLDGNSAAIELSNGASGSGLNNWFLRAGATGTNTPAGGLSIGDNLGYRMVIDNLGNVAIGSLFPTARLDVRANMTTTSFIENTSLGIGTTGLFAFCQSFPGRGRGIEGDGGFVGVVGRSDPPGQGDRTGVWGLALDGETNYGVQAYASGGTRSYGIYATADFSPTGWAGYFSGTVFTNASYQTSDRKLKTDIRPISEPLSIINQLNPSMYTYKTNEFPQMHLSDGTHYGLIADEVEQLIPGIVKNAVQPAVYENQHIQASKKISDEVSFNAINYTELIPILIGGMKEQQLMIANQNKKIEQLQQQIDELRKLQK